MTTTPVSSHSDATRLAVERTRLAHERTMMAWVRTATSLISFKFSIYKFFEYLRSSQQAGPPRGLIGTRGFALIMILMGLGALVLATIENGRNMHALRLQYGELVPSSLATVLASLIAGLGVLGLLAVIFQL